MKYLVVGLLLVVNLVGGSARVSPEPWSRSALATFRTVDPSGVVTTVDVDVNETPASRQVVLSIERAARACKAGVCRNRDLISGTASQQVGPGDMTIDPHVRYGTIHGGIPVHDDVSNRALLIRVDVVWIATGPETCDPLYAALGCFRTATASGDVGSGALMLIFRQTDPDGRLLHRLVQD